VSEKGHGQWSGQRRRASALPQEADPLPTRLQASSVPEPVVCSAPHSITSSPRASS